MELPPVGPPISRRGSATEAVTQSPFQRLLNNPMLLNIMAQSGYSTTPGPSPLGVVGRAGLMTNQQNQRSALSDAQRIMLESQTGFNKARTDAINNPAPEQPETFTPLSPDDVKALGLDPSKSYQRSNTSNKVSQIGGSGVTVNTGDAESNSIFGVPTDVRTSLGTQANDARSSQITRQAAGEALTLLRSDNAPFTGAAAGLKEAGARLLDVIASDDSTSEEVEAARASLAASEASDSQTGIMVGQIIKLFGSGTGLSDADREFAKKIAGALRSGSKQGLERILEGAFSRSTREIDDYNSRISRVQDRFEDTDVLFQPIEKRDFDFSGFSIIERGK